MSPQVARQKDQREGLPAFSAPYAPPDEALAETLLREAQRPADAEARIDARATRLVEAIRAKSGGLGGIEDFLRDCDIDGLMFVYDDYVEGLRVTAREILPQLRKAFA